MKHILAAIGIVTSILTSCGAKKPQETSGQDWREMDVLAVTMEQAFRPLKDASRVDAALEADGPNC